MTNMNRTPTGVPKTVLVDADGDVTATLENVVSGLTDINDTLGSSLTVTESPAYSVGVTKDKTANDSDKTFTVPASTEWYVLQIMVKLTTTATAGTRRLRIDIGDGTDVIFAIAAGGGQAASIVQNYLIQPTVGRVTATDTASTTEVQLLVQLPPALILPAGYTVRVYDVNAVDAAADDMEVYILRGARSV